ncbi:FAD-binding protein [Exilibacterium tricleocarpae]|uniref:FAD-binding protein n=1 Tax=Exilibacterium tricleocarpae TaxID=2591008 RepID=A0A545U9V7_9GAMM|nr:FAD-binding oxidoreductase [Exilibacterium tricleocarpae]TQV86193.1 FAD-binding protein [Exilibacterium tricleocarpae]
MPEATKQQLQTLQQALQEVGLHRRINTDPALLALYDHDVFFQAAHRPLAVLQPRRCDEIGPLVTCAGGSELSIEVRAGGLSYSGGYLPQNATSVILDVSLLNGIDYAHQTTDIVVVEAGATWQQLDDFLHGSGMRPALSAPFSGSVSTIGGAIRQGLPADMHAVLALEIIAADGTVFHTGSLATDALSCSAWRGQGPDLTGLFIGDCGALGILGRAWIKLEPQPLHRRFFACAVNAPDEYLSLLEALAPLPGNYRAYCFDPGRSKNLQTQGFWQQLRTGARVLLGKSNPLQTVQSAGQMFRTLLQWRDTALSGTWGVHVICESHCRQEANALERRAADTAASRGFRRLTTSVAEVLNTRPYSVRGMLGRRYERWLPAHGIFPLAARRKLGATLLKALDDIRRRLGPERVECHMLLINAGRHHVLIEPMFLWDGELYPLHLKHCPQAEQKSPPANHPVSDTEIWEARKDLVALMDSLGAQHVQLGRSYEYLSRLNPVTRRLIRQLKRGVDPGNTLAPGILGLTTKEDA